MMNSKKADWTLLFNQNNCIVTFTHNLVKTLYFVLYHTMIFQKIIEHKKIIKRFKNLSHVVTG
jgi:hypothetical protein